MPDHPKKRLLVVSTLNTADWGGSEELWAQAVELLDGVDRHHLGSYRLLPRPLHHLRSQGLHLHRLHLPRLSHALSRLGASLPALGAARRAWLRRRIVALRPDLVLLNLACHRDGVELLPALVASGLPYVLVVQSSSWSEWPSDGECEALSPAWAAARAIVCVSADNADIVSAHFGIPRERIRILRNPCSCELAGPPPSYPGFSEGPRLAVVGRVLFRQKGHDLLLRALASGAFPPDEPWSLHVYGAGDNVKALSRFAAQLGLGARVVVHGHVSEPSLIWHRCHALVLTSRQEGAALVNYEAMMSGRPVFTTPCNAEHVVPAITGLVASDCDVAAISSMLRDAWTSRDHWETWGLEGRRLAEATASQSSPALAILLKTLLDES